jgi:hypothetical protein
MSAELEKGLYTVLAGASPQTSAAARVYPRVPQNPTFPLIHYQRVSTLRGQTLTGDSGPVAATLQVDCMGESYSAVKTLADEVRTILSDYTGTWGTLYCYNVFLESENDLSDQEGDRVTHWVAQRYTVWTDMS